MRIHRALVALLVLTGTLVVGGAVPAGAAAEPEAAEPPAAGRAWSDGPCASTDNRGITVVIDFQELGGGVNVRCADGPVSSGADALDKAGINWQGVHRWGRAFVCRIAGKPGDDPCIDTPPASAHWGYWVASRGGDWCSSSWGLANRRPPPGTVEGWSFSLNRQGGTSPPPRYAPPGLAAGLDPNPLPGNDCDPDGGQVDPSTPATRPPAGGSGGSGSGGSGSSGGGQGSGSGGSDGATGGAPGGAGSGQPRGPLDTRPPVGPSTATTAPDGPTTSVGPTTSPKPGGTMTGRGEGAGRGVSPTDGGSGSGSADERAAGRVNRVNLSSDGDEQSGFPLSTVIGALLVAGLGAIAVVQVRRRRALVVDTTPDG